MDNLTSLWYNIYQLWSHSGGSAVYKFRRKILSQNFIYDRTLIKKLVRGSSIGFQDTVLEIGPGKGFITSELLQVAKRVIAVELDHKLVLHLQKFFGNNPKLDLYLADFLNFPIPRTQYKVFANIPFSIEGKIVRKLIEDKNPPEDCYLVVRRDLAERLSGVMGNNQFSIKNRPWFSFNIYYRFNRNDFIPRPSMDCVMWRITKKEGPLVSIDQKQNYQRFIELAFGEGQTIENNLKRLMTREQLQNLSKKLSFSLKTKPSHLSLGQWLELYHNAKRAE